MIAINGYLDNQSRLADCRKWLTASGTLSVMKRPDIRQTLAKRLQELMAATPHLDTQVKVAARAKIAQSTVGRILRAEVYAQLAQVESLAEAFRVSPSLLLADDANSLSDALTYDEAGYNELPEADKEQIKAFIEFTIQRHKGKPANAALCANTKKEPPPGLKERLLNAIQRELNDDTLTIGNDRKDQTIPPKRSRRTSSQ
ncbi:helix-turn-helix domain-containing protein [Burkholderia multivorans]|uniref:helix-turn-helix domain-containing protein n=1 Tax=Burkholderia multivorans TaxID=87883 RepID=UPI001C24B48A|nr:helix-turn-helix transcriptional regulator [Burkholderia multivorans]MBU9145382.1 helix-turn-helix domain-containing protein [Burkholderia multivorans]MBU9540303.1 helix-turn-helix domain-containing protein [Burkholderia multivorans]HEF4770810.1 helix-turn-helix transcriptional regulator [Burkholderia multivorans]